jgi:hypothetical protein
MKKNTTFYETIIHSPEWEAWMKHNEQHDMYDEDGNRLQRFDVNLSMETGWLGKKHFAAFLAWVADNPIKHE